MRAVLSLLGGASVAVLAGVAKAVASVAAVYAPAPASEDSLKWHVVGATRSTAARTEPLGPEISGFIEAAVTAPDLENLIRTSYAMASRAEIAALDAAWVEMLTRRASSEDVELYLRVRSALRFPEGETAEYYLENWVWKAFVDTGCDSAAGGGADSFGNFAEATPGDRGASGTA
jgi:hypothetical protein